MVITSLAIPQKILDEINELSTVCQQSRSATMRMLLAISLREIRAANTRSLQRVADISSGKTQDVEGITPDAGSRGVLAQTVQWWREQHYKSRQSRPRAAYLAWMAGKYPRVTPDDAGAAFDEEWPYQVKMMREKA